MEGSVRDTGIFKRTNSRVDGLTRQLDNDQAFIHARLISRVFGFARRNFNSRFISCNFPCLGNVLNS